MVFLATKAALAATIFGIGVTFGALNYLQRHNQENNGASATAGGVLGQSRTFEFTFPSKAPLPTYLATVYLPTQSSNGAATFRLFGHNPPAPPPDCDCKVVHECSSFSGASSTSFRLKRTCGFQGFQRKICCDEPPPLYFSTPHPQLALDEMRTAHAQLSPSQSQNINCNHEASQNHDCNCDYHNSGNEDSNTPAVSSTVPSFSSEEPPTPSPSTTEGKAETIEVGKPVDVNDYFRDDVKSTTPNLSRDIAVIVSGDDDEDEQVEQDVISRTGLPAQDDQDQVVAQSTENSVELKMTTEGPKVDSTTEVPSPKKVMLTLENITFPNLSEYFPENGDVEASDVSNRFAVTTAAPVETELSMQSSTQSQSTTPEASPSPLMPVYDYQDHDHDHDQTTKKVEEDSKPEPEVKAVEESIPDVTETIVRGSLKGTRVPQSLEFIKNEGTEKPVGDSAAVSRQPFALAPDTDQEERQSSSDKMEEVMTTPKVPPVETTTVVDLDSNRKEIDTSPLPAETTGNPPALNSNSNADDMNDEDMQDDKFYPRPMPHFNDSMASNESTTKSVGITETPIDLPTESNPMTTSGSALPSDLDMTTVQGQAENIMETETTTPESGFSARSANAQSQEPATIVETDSTTEISQVSSSLAPGELESLPMKVTEKSVVPQTTESEPDLTTVAIIAKGKDDDSVGITEGTLNIVEVLTSTETPPSTAEPEVITVKSDSEVTPAPVPEMAMSTTTTAVPKASRTGEPETKLPEEAPPVSTLPPETTGYPLEGAEDMQKTTAIPTEVAESTTIIPDARREIGDATTPKSELEEVPTTPPTSSDYESTSKKGLVKVPEVASRIGIATEIVNLETTTTTSTNVSNEATTTAKPALLPSAKPKTTTVPPKTKEGNKEAAEMTTTILPNEMIETTTAPAPKKKKKNKGQPPSFAVEGESTTSKMKTFTLESAPMENEAPTEKGVPITENPADISNPAFKIKKKTKKPKTTTMEPPENVEFVTIEYDEALDNLMMKFDNVEPDTQMESQSQTTPKSLKVVVSDDMHLEFSATTTEPEVEGEEQEMLSSNEDMGITSTTMSSLELDNGNNEPITEITKSIRREPDTDKTVVELKSMSSKQKSKVTKVVTAVRSGSEASVSELTTESPFSTTTGSAGGIEVDVDFPEQTTETSNGVAVEEEIGFRTGSNIVNTSVEAFQSTGEPVSRTGSSANTNTTYEIELEQTQMTPESRSTEKVLSDEVETEQPEGTTEIPLMSSGPSESGNSSMEQVLEKVVIENDGDDQELLQDATTSRTGTEIPSENSNQSSSMDADAAMISSETPVVDSTTEIGIPTGADPSKEFRLDEDDESENSTSDQFMLDAGEASTSTERFTPVEVELNDEEMEGERMMSSTKIPMVDRTTENVVVFVISADNRIISGAEMEKGENATQFMSEVEETTTDGDDELGNVSFGTTSKSVSLTRELLEGRSDFSDGGLENSNISTLTPLESSAVSSTFTQTQNESDSNSNSTGNETNALESMSKFDESRESDEHLEDVAATGDNKTEEIMPGAMSDMDLTTTTTSSPISNSEGITTGASISTEEETATDVSISGRSASAVPDKDSASPISETEAPPAPSEPEATTVQPEIKEETSTKLNENLNDATAASTSRAEEDVDITLTDFRSLSQDTSEQSTTVKAASDAENDAPSDENEETTTRQEGGQETSTKLNDNPDETTTPRITEVKIEDNMNMTGTGTDFRSPDQVIPEQSTITTTVQELIPEEKPDTINQQETGEIETSTVNTFDETETTTIPVAEAKNEEDTDTETPLTNFRFLEESSTLKESIAADDIDGGTTPFTVNLTEAASTTTENILQTATMKPLFRGQHETTSTSSPLQKEDTEIKEESALDTSTLPTLVDIVQGRIETGFADYANPTMITATMEDELNETSTNRSTTTTIKSTTGLPETTSMPDLHLKDDVEQETSTLAETEMTATPSTPPVMEGQSDEPEVTLSTEEDESTTTSSFSKDLSRNSSTSGSDDEASSSTFLQEIYDTLFGPSGRSARVNNLGDHDNDNSTDAHAKTTTTPEPLFKVQVKVGPYDSRALFSSDTTDQEKQLEDEISNVVGQLLLTTHKNFHLLPNFVECAGARGRTGRRKTKVLQFDTDNYPWMARIGYREPAGVLFPCAGTIITHRYILTSAHCATRKQNRDASIMEVLLEGAKNAAAGMSDQSQYKFKVEEIRVHPNYNQISRENDIALIRLAKEIPSFNGTSDVKPICLPFEDGYGVWDSLPGVGDTAYLGGWGYGLKNMAATVEEMEEAAVTIWSRENCTHLYRGDKDKKITSHHICAYGKAEKDACRGDAGGPLMALMTRQKIFFQVGIVSYGPRCGYGVPGVYTNVRDYLMWLLDSMHA